MAEKNFSIGTRNFQLNKINALKQFHVVRRISPILADILPVAKKMSDSKDADPVLVLEPIMRGFSKLSDEDSNKVLLTLLESVEIQQSHGNWAFVAANGTIMFQDLELPMLLQIAGRAFMYNLSGFFAVLPQVS